MRPGTLALLLIIGGPLLASCGEPLRVQPKATSALLANPGMGWQTFHRFADEDPTLQGLPSGSAYFRFYWREIEPQEGKIDFAKFDQLLQRCSKAGQKLAFRIMCTGSEEYMDVPKWLKEQGCAGTEFLFEGKKHWVPDFTDPRFEKAHFRLIQELGKRYDSHPDMDLLDIGSVGLWAEWHMGGTKAADTGKEVPLPPVATRLKIIEEWARAFPQSRKVVLIGSEEAMALTVQRGLGWRADCLGDMGGFSKNWNHMDNFYLQQVRNSGAGDAWKQSPVAFESCWDMRKWTTSGWNVQAIFDYALNLHASYVNNKSAPIPAGTRREIELLLRKLGYRLVLRSLQMPSVINTDVVQVQTSWENEGVAPPYVSHRMAFRFSSKNSSQQPETVITATSVRGWLPGAHNEQVQFKKPKNLTPGAYVVSLGLLNPANGRAEIRLPIDLKESEGWYALGEVEVR